MEYMASQKPSSVPKPGRRSGDSRGLVDTGSIAPFEGTVGDHILARPWFARTWILQELVLSADPWIQIGETRVRWDLFCGHVLPSTSPSWRPFTQRTMNAP